MNRITQLRALSGLAALMRDQSLEALRRADQRCQETRDLIAGLAAPPAEDIAPLIQAQAEIAYTRWADQRRAELNLCLARQMAEWVQCQDAARITFGKAEVLRRLGLQKTL
ncbi:hypothetical protein KM031_10080 [Gemmobacter fulvus]|uniref:Uncharacterized protein n=1 Tax=Gemmobacter fulvus TaxID=2840474 RepID=A0A975P3U8_9RHOB|nr:hypothetical protein [Gemmobacter fulvus]MBT9246671.1 hypothetical protein [Gemmobacter fulvus]MDQ1846842.1 hypothetical protein [Gemmobacter fulvus]QWK89220.1 hypothetical protein KM031_10080 [Gemmobacter fulvus]